MNKKTKTSYNEKIRDIKFLKKLLDMKNEGINVRTIAKKENINFVTAGRIIRIAEYAFDEKNRKYYMEVAECARTEGKDAAMEKYKLSELTTNLFVRAAEIIPLLYLGTQENKSEKKENNTERIVMEEKYVSNHYDGLIKRGSFNNDDYKKILPFLTEERTVPYRISVGAKYSSCIIREDKIADFEKIDPKAILLMDRGIVIINSLKLFIF